MAAEITFGSWLKNSRKRLDFTQDELARRIGCSLMLIQKLEADERRPSKQIAELLAACFAVSADEYADFVRFARSRQPCISPSVHAPWRTFRRQVLNLPTPPAPLFGRQQEIETIVQQVAREHVPLLTLVGPPGIGKTRLAVEAAEALVDHFDDGVVFVSLASVRDPDRVGLTIAQSLGLKESGCQSISENLQKHLADKRLLLVTDNWEQVISAAPLAAELLAACPWVQILATSRISLHIRPERQFHVAPLALAPADTTEWSALLTCPAVELFVDRAQAVDSEFTLNTENAPATAEICARLDGLPLAIELAAARVISMSPQEILAQLKSRLKLGSEGPRDMPRRHQSLRDAIDWSYELSRAEERRLFASLGVFSGGFTQAMAETVCGTATPHLKSSLEALVDMNLVVKGQPAGEETRFAMLETIREYASERLAATEGAEGLYRRHAENMIVLVESADTHLSGPEQVAWADRLVCERSNLEAALQWTVEHREAELALRLGSALWVFWYRQGWLIEGRKWLARALELTGSSDDLQSLRIKALIGAGNLAWSHGDYAAAEQLGRESHAMATRLQDKEQISHALHLLAIVAIDQSEYDRARELLQQNLVFERALGDRPGLMSTLTNLGRIAYYRGESARAIPYYEEALELFRMRGDRFNIALTLNNLGGTLADNLELGRAREILEEGRRLAEGSGEPLFVLVYILVHLGRTALYAGDYAGAEGLLGQGLAEAQANKSKTGTAFALLHLGQLALRRGDPGMAARLLGEGLDIQRPFEEKGTGLRWLVTLVALMLARNDQVSAATLSGAIEGICASASIRLVPACAGEHAKSLKALAAMDEHTNRAARERGCRMTIAQAFEFAVQHL